MKNKRKHPKIDINDPDLEIPPLTDEQLRSMKRITPERHIKFCKMLENTFHRPFPPRLGRPPKAADEKYRDIHLKLHPKALNWAQREGKRRGIGYQTVINEVLLRHAA